MLVVGKVPDFHCSEAVIGGRRIRVKSRQSQHAEERRFRSPLANQERRSTVQPGAERCKPLQMVAGSCYVRVVQTMS
jgi:hypothetical protein